MSTFETTIRLTNFCNETCEHCVYRSGPSNKVHLTEKMSQQLNGWIPKKRNSNICVFGGEVSLIPGYERLMQNIFRGHYQGGVITNGVFVKKRTAFNRFIRMVLDLDVQAFTIRVSQSQFHSKDRYGQEAFEKLKRSFQHERHVFVQLVQDLGLRIIPVGRAYDNNIPTQLQNESMCSIASNNHVFVDENGMIHWCPLGESPHKHFLQCDYHETRKKIMEWRTEITSQGANCLLCSRYGVGHIPSPTFISPSKHKIHCIAGGSNGMV